MHISRIAVVLSLKFKEPARHSRLAKLIHGPSNRDFFRVYIDSSAIKDFFCVYMASSNYEGDISSNFFRTFGIFLQDLRGFKAKIAFIYRALARHKFQLDLGFYNANFDWFMCCQMRVLIS